MGFHYIMNSPRICNLIILMYVKSVNPDELLQYSYGFLHGCLVVGHAANRMTILN